MRGIVAETETLVIDGVERMFGDLRALGQPHILDREPQALRGRLIQELENAADQRFFAARDLVHVWRTRGMEHQDPRVQGNSRIHCALEKVEHGRVGLRRRHVPLAAARRVDGANPQAARIELLLDVVLAAGGEVAGVFGVSPQRQVREPGRADHARLLGKRYLVVESCGDRDHCASSANHSPTLRSQDSRVTAYELTLSQRPLRLTTCDIGAYSHSRRRGSAAWEAGKSLCPRFLSPRPPCSPSGWPMAGRLLYGFSARRSER